jgi:carnitine-CoA ligase
MNCLPDRSFVVIRHILERQASERPDRECIVFDGGPSWTYAEALLQAYRAANALARVGVRRGENVLIFMPNCPDWVRAWWGVSSLGAVMVPVNTALKGDLLKHVCTDSGARHILTTPHMAERLKDCGLDLNIIDPDVLARGSGAEPELERPIEPWDTLAIYYTSGTTGRSKGVITPHFQLYTGGSVWRRKGTENDTILLSTPFFHIAGLQPFLAFWSMGGRAVSDPVFSGSRLLDRVRECGATMTLTVGSIGEFLAKMPPKPDDAENPLRLMVVTPMVSDPDAFVARFGLDELIAAYGMTELSAPIVTPWPINDPKSCGKAVEGVQLRLVDENDIPAPVGEVGELIVRTDLPWAINAGYWNRPEETAKAWQNGWFHTGDLFRCDPDGNFFFADRKKDAIRRRGENISSFEVEISVMAYDHVHEVACVGAPGEFGDQEVKVFVVPKEGSNIDPADLIGFLIPRMPYFMVPRYVEIVSELPKTPTMRVKKHELVERGNTANTWDREAAGIKVKRDQV